MNFTMNRNFTVASTMGHAVEFIKGVPTHVPPALYAEVQAVGAIPEEEIPEDEAAAKSNEPSDPLVRKSALFEAFDKIALRGRREDFTAGGSPTNAVLAAELGWTVAAKERDIVWAEFKISDK